MTPPDAPRSRDVGRKTTRRTILLVIAGVVAVLIAAIAWVGVRGMLLKNELEAMVPLASQIEDALGARDLARVDDLIGDLRAHAAEADALSGDPVWRLAELTPGVGANLTAARVVSAHLHSISSAAAPVVDILTSPGSSGDAGLDVGLLARLGKPLQQTSSAFSAADSALAELDTAALLPPLAEGVQRLRTMVSEVAPPLATIAPAAQALPSMLGQDGPRNLLVMLQNNAEVRTGGGITGSFALLRADQGELTLVDQVDSSEFPGGSEPIAAVPDSTTELFGDQFARFVQNTSMTPDFTLTAELAKAWWATSSDQEPDAIISLDVPAIAALLRATGPVQLPEGELTADNFVQVMLQDVYLALDRDQQTAFQQRVTAAVFASALSGDTDVLALMDALAPPVDQGRISMWSADPDIEGLLEDSVFGGERTRHSMAGEGAFAVYFNDATTGKMGPFLDVSLDVGREQCRTDGLTDAVVTVTLANTASPDAGQTLPWWVSGGGIEGVPPGDISTAVSVAAPPDAFFGGVSVDGQQLPSTDVVDQGFPTSGAMVTLHPGETKSMQFRFTVDLEQRADLSLLHTPLVSEPEVTASGSGCR